MTVGVDLIRNNDHRTLGMAWAEWLRHRGKCGLAWIMEGYGDKHSPEGRIQIMETLKYLDGKLALIL